MPLGRSLLSIAIVAALLGAPSTVFGAANGLTAPSVAPTSGTTETVFTFSVRYDGRFPATRVEVAAGPRTVAMALVAGSSTSGTWRASAMLPAGTWPVAFAAVPAQGPAPTLAGPNVSVSAVAAPSIAAPVPPPQEPAMPTPVGAAPDGRSGDEPTGGTPSGDAGGSGTDGDVSEPDTAVTDAPERMPAEPDPVTSGGGAAGASADSPSGEGDALTPPGAEPAAGARGGAGGTTEDGSRAAGATSAVVSARDGRSPASAPAAPGSTDSEADRAHADTDAVVTLVIVVGLAGVAAVAILGALMLLAGRRRRPADDRATADAGTPPVPSDAGDRRAIRRHRAGLSDDPILAALGVDDEMAARRARRRARQAAGDGRRETARGD